MAYVGVTGLVAASNLLVPKRVVHHRRRIAERRSALVVLNRRSRLRRERLSGQSGRVRAVLVLLALWLTACTSSEQGSAVTSTTLASQEQVSAAASTTLAVSEQGSAVTSTTLAPTSPDACGPSEEVYVRSGLFARLPPGTTLNLRSTADEVPHAEAGATLSIAGADFEIWRALQYGPDAVPDVSGRVDNGVSVFVRAENPAEQACLLAGLRYDASRDVD